MKSALVKFGAYLILLLGILIALAFVGASVYVYIFYPEANAQKRAMVGTGFLIFGIILLIISIAIFEAMIELTRIEEKTDPMAEEEEKDELNE